MFEVLWLWIAMCIISPTFMMSALTATIMGEADLLLQEIQFILRPAG
jgi:hypothetical protein